MNLLLNRPNSPSRSSLPATFTSQSSTSTFSKPDPHDIQFESYYQKIMSLKSSFANAELLRIQKWMKRLKQGKYKYIAQKRNRNLYAKLLIHQMTRGRLDSPPFHVVPPRMEEQLPSLPAYQVATISNGMDSPKHRLVEYAFGTGSGSALVKRSATRRRARSVPKSRRLSVPKSQGLHAHEVSVFEYSNGTPVGKRDAAKVSFVTRDGMEFTDSPTWKERAKEPSFSSKVLASRILRGEDDSTSEDEDAGLSSLRRVSMIPKSSESMMSSQSDTTSFTSKSTPITRTNSSSTAVTRSDLVHHTLSRQLSHDLDAFTRQQQHAAVSENEPLRRASSPLVLQHPTSPESHRYQNESTPQRRSSAQRSTHIPRPQPIQISNSAFSTPTHSGDVISDPVGSHASSYGSMDPLTLEKLKNKQLQEEMTSLRQQLLEARNHISYLEQDLRKKDEECAMVLEQSLQDDQLFMQQIESMLDRHGRNLLEDRSNRKNLSLG